MICFLLLAGCTTPQRRQTEPRSDNQVGTRSAQPSPQGRGEFIRPRVIPARTERAWARTLLRNERVVWPGQVKEMIQVGLQAPANKNILYESGHTFMFMLSSELGREVDCEIRVVDMKTGELLTRPGFSSHLYGIKGHALIGVPIWRNGMIPAGQTMTVSVQIYISSGEAPIKIGIALLMSEFTSQTVRTATRESDLEEW